MHIWFHRRLKRCLFFCSHWDVKSRAYDSHPNFWLFWRRMINERKGNYLLPRAERMDCTGFKFIFFFCEKSIEHTELVHNQNTAQQIEFYPINTMCLLKILEAVIFFSLASSLQNVTILMQLVFIFQLDSSTNDQSFTPRLIQSVIILFNVHLGSLIFARNFLIFSWFKKPLSQQQTFPPIKPEGSWHFFQCFRVFSVPSFVSRK